MQRLLACCLFALAAACGGDITEPEQSIAGTYTLQSIDGRALPVILLAGGPTSISVMSGTITLDANGTWTETGSFGMGQDGATTTEDYADRGTWVLTDHSIVLNSSVFGVTAYTGSVDSRQLNLKYMTFDYLFER